MRIQAVKAGPQRVRDPRPRAWSDCGDDVESVFSEDEILPIVSIY